MTSTPEAQLQELSIALGLIPELQDWGVINADAARVDEFMRYYERTPKLTPGQRLQLGELILASANERLLDDAGAPVDEVLAFVRRHVHELKLHLDYWRALEGDEFPLAVRLGALRR